MTLLIGKAYLHWIYGPNTLIAKKETTGPKKSSQMKNDNYDHLMEVEQCPMECHHVHRMQGVAAANECLTTNI